MGHTSGNLSEDKIAKDNRLQKVYDTIREERPWDIRKGSKLYTTVKEKYMIKMIVEGYDISNETIEHVVKRCYTEPHSLSDGTYSCWYGFLQTNSEFRSHDYINCCLQKLEHPINDVLLCYHGAFYYPKDIMTNPFGSWQPKPSATIRDGVAEVLKAVERKWPGNWYDDELHKYTLKYLINLINNGEDIQSDIITHVVDGCFRSKHNINDRYQCCYGFILTQNEFHDFDRCRSDHDINNSLHCYHGVLKFIMNRKFYQNSGIRTISIQELRFRKYQTAQHSLTENIRSLNMQKVKNVLERIKFKDLISPCLENRMCTTWQEKYLISRVVNGDDIPNEIITHALEGCYTWGHLLNENYGCCRGYIVDRQIFSHTFTTCFNHHLLTEDLMCYRGKVHHRNDEVPIGARV